MLLLPWKLPEHGDEQVDEKHIGEHHVDHEQNEAEGDAALFALVLGRADAQLVEYLHLAVDRPVRLVDHVLEELEVELVARIQGRLAMNEHTNVSDFFYV